MEKNIRSLISKFEVLSNSIANETKTPKPTRPRFNFATPKAPLPKEKLPETPKETPTYNNFYKNNNAKLNDIQLEISEMLKEISTLSEIPVETFIRVLQTLVVHLITLGSIDAEGNYNLKQKKAACFQKIQECNAEIMKGRNDVREEPKSINSVRNIEKEAFENKIYKEREEEEEEEEVEVVQFKSVKEMKSMFDVPGTPTLQKTSLWKSRESFGSCGSIGGSNNDISVKQKIVKAKSVETVVEKVANNFEEINNDESNIIKDSEVKNNLTFEKFEETKKEPVVPVIEIQAATPMTPMENPQEFPNLKSVSLMKYFFEPQSDQTPTRENVEKNAKLNKLIKELEVEENENIIEEQTRTEEEIIEDEQAITNTETVVEETIKDVEETAFSDNENVNSVFEKICDDFESDAEDLFEALINEESLDSAENKESGGEYSSLESSEAESVIHLKNDEYFVNTNLKDFDEHSDSGDTVENEETKDKLEDVEKMNKDDDTNVLKYPAKLYTQPVEDSSDVESTGEKDIVNRLEVCAAASEDCKVSDLEVKNAELSVEYNQEIYKEERTSDENNKNVCLESRIVKQIVDLKRSHSEQSLDGLDEIDEVFSEIIRYRAVIDKFDPKKDLSKFDELEMQLHMLLVRIEKIKTNNNEQLENMVMDGVEMIDEIITNFHKKV